MANIEPHHLEGIKPAPSADRQTLRWLETHDPQHKQRMRSVRKSQRNERNLYVRSGPARPTSAGIKRRTLVKQGRYLVVHDLGGPSVVAGVDDVELAQRHQRLFLGKTMKVQFHTWFKIVAQRTHNGWDQAHRRQLSAGERGNRLGLLQQIR